MADKPLKEFMKTTKGNVGTRRKIFGIGILASISLGTVIILIVPFELDQMKKVQKWPSREGRITKSSLIEDEDMDRSKYWRAHISGAYIDTQEPVTVFRVRYGSFTFGGGRKAIRDTVKQYPKGKEITVYYDPQNPTRTVLEKILPAGRRTMYAAFFSGSLHGYFPSYLYQVRSNDTKQNGGDEP